MIRRLRAERKARLARWEAECARVDQQNHRRLDHKDGRA